LMAWIQEGSPNSTAIVRAVYALLDGKGRWETRLVGAKGEQNVTLMLTNGILAEAGRSVDLAVTRSNSTVRLYLDGREVPYSQRVVKEGSAWSTDEALVSLHSGRIMGPRDDGRILSITLLGRSLLPREVAALYAMPAGMGPADDLWAKADTQPLVHVSPQSLSLKTWSATGYNGRERYYQDAHRMRAGYPALFGSGPGPLETFTRRICIPTGSGTIFGTCTMIISRRSSHSVGAA